MTVKPHAESLKSHRLRCFEAEKAFLEEGTKLAFRKRQEKATRQAAQKVASTLKDKSKVDKMPSRIVG